MQPLKIEGTFAEDEDNIGNEKEYIGQVASKLCIIVQREKTKTKETPKLADKTSTVAIGKKTEELLWEEKEIDLSDNSKKDNANLEMKCDKIFEQFK